MDKNYLGKQDLIFINIDQVKQSLWQKKYLFYTAWTYYLALYSGSYICPENFTVVIARMLLNGQCCLLE